MSKKRCQYLSLFLSLALMMTMGMSMTFAEGDDLKVVINHNEKRVQPILFDDHPNLPIRETLAHFKYTLKYEKGGKVTISFGKKAIATFKLGSKTYVVGKTTYTFLVKPFVEGGIMYMDLNSLSKVMDMEFYYDYPNRTITAYTDSYFGIDHEIKGYTFMHNNEGGLFYKKADKAIKTVFIEKGTGKFDAEIASFTKKINIDIENFKVLVHSDRVMAYYYENQMASESQYLMINNNGKIYMLTFANHTEQDVMALIKSVFK